MDTIFSWLLGKVKDYVVRNWRTSLVGVVAAVCTQIPALAPFKDGIIAVALALGGLVAKDASVTGTTAQPAPRPAPELAPVQVIGTSGPTDPVL